MKKSDTRYRPIIKVQPSPSLIVVFVFCFLFPDVVYCSSDQLIAGISMAEISANITRALRSIAGIIHSVAVFGGIAFFVAFAFKLKQHRDNPTQVTIGQPLLYLFLAIILCMLPWFISTTARMFYGTEAAVSQWNHSQMSQLFGGRDEDFVVS